MSKGLHRVIWEKSWNHINGARSRWSILRRGARWRGFPRAVERKGPPLRHETRLSGCRFASPEGLSSSLFSSFPWLSSLYSSLAFPNSIKRIAIITELNWLFPQPRIEKIGFCEWYFGKIRILSWMALSLVVEDSQNFLNLKLVLYFSCSVSELFLFNVGFWCMYWCCWSCNSSFGGILLYLLAVNAMTLLSRFWGIEWEVG